MMPNLLLRGGTVILLGESDSLSTMKADILIHENLIVKIQPNIAGPETCEVIDCTDKIISPGFVDTHRHMWETALKGVCEDLTGAQYFATMFSASLSFTPEDCFWGNLSGCLEAIDAGTTTALDYAHGTQSLAGTLSSGIRSITALAPAVTLTRTKPEVVISDLIPDWFMPFLERVSLLSSIASKASRVQLGLGFDYFFLPKNIVIGIFNKARSLGIDIVTSYYARLKGESGDAVLQLLKSYGLLDERLVLSHAGGATEDDGRLLIEAGTFIAASPSVESTMGLGPPNCFRVDRPGLDAVCSFGTDCHCNTSSSMVNEMRMGLLLARGNHSAKKLSNGSIPRSICRTAHDAYIMGTIQGARALNMQDEIGSIAVGKKADLVVFDALSPAMACAAQVDPVNAIVMHSSISDIRMVIIDGIVRKREGELVASEIVEWDERSRSFVECTTRLSWRDVAKRVMETQQRFLATLQDLDMKSLEEFVVRFFTM